MTTTPLTVTDKVPEQMVVFPPPPKSVYEHEILPPPPEESHISPPPPAMFSHHRFVLLTFYAVDSEVFFLNFSNTVVFQNLKRYKKLDYSNQSVDNKQLTCSLIGHCLKNFSVSA